jgi:hypothetical protein
VRRCTHRPSAAPAPLGVPSKPFAVGGALAAGVEATTAYYPNAGDVLVADAERGVRIPPDSWLAPGVGRETARARRLAEALAV